MIEAGRAPLVSRAETSSPPPPCCGSRLPEFLLGTAPSPRKEWNNNSPTPWALNPPTSHPAWQAEKGALKRAAPEREKSGSGEAAAVKEGIPEKKRRFIHSGGDDDDEGSPPGVMLVAVTGSCVVAEDGPEGDGGLVGVGVGMVTEGL